MSSALQVHGLPGRRRSYTAKVPAGTAVRSPFDRVFGNSAVNPFFREMGRAVYYESKVDGAGHTTAILGAEETREIDAPTGDRQYERVRPLTIRRTPEFPTVAVGTLGAVRPSAGDVVTADNVRYVVRRVLNDSPDMATLELVRFETMEVSRPQYRGRQR